MNNFQNNFRTKSVRAPFWDYGWNAAYFVTINTRNREYFFGDVIHGIMERSAIGDIADNLWLEIPEHYSFIRLGKHIVMPNHIHGIVIIDKPIDPRFVEPQTISGHPSVATNSPGGATGQKNPMLHDNLSNIIRWYKGRTSFESRKLVPEFAWQHKFHDHIIRDENSFQRISNYIINNPTNWRNDKFYRK